MEHFFSHRVSGAELEHFKPHPEIFQVASRLAQVSPCQCLVIEDSMNGVLAAKAVKMKCIGFRNPKSGDQDLSKADRIIDNIQDLNLRVLLSFK
jgi:beta-phosphoglucomutase-like phosphatase (HAD superfamily)